MMKASTVIHCLYLTVEMLTEKGILDPEIQDEGVEDRPDLEYQVLGDKLELWMHLGVELSSINRQKTPLVSLLKRQVRSLPGVRIHSLRAKQEPVTSRGAEQNRISTRTTS